ncbi:Uncharacterised protein [Dermatophilus congolensis]|uniref:Uncharacterized protein n=3 Tax=Dermatophilus congolensis TaxID=1863 RepID=A0AA46BLC7_9MICO|nr:Uncharacterised protein [Dermatophilus congolensis]
MTTQRLPHGDGQAVRTPDGTYMHIAPNTDADTLATALANRTQSRRPHHPTITTHGQAPQLFDPLLAALATACTTPNDNTTPPTIALHAITTPEDENLAHTHLTNGTTILAVHREDDVLYIHPLATPNDPQAISPHHIRARRLAASPAPDLAHTHWHTHGGDPLTDLPHHAAHLASAHLLTNLLTHLHHIPQRGPHLLTRIEMTPLRITTHPIIAVPPTEPLPAGR